MLYTYTFPLFVSTIIAILASDVTVVDDRSSLFFSRFFSFLYIYIYIHTRGSSSLERFDANKWDSV